MSRLTSTKFDGVAALYDSSVSPLPQKFCLLLKKRFGLTQNDRVIDLGCGTGALTFVLSRFSSHVEGIDISEKMIEIARSRDTDKKVKWTHDEVENFDFGHNRYSLIISCEAFHLFSNVDELVKKCTHGLKRNGFLCVAWYSCQWEKPLKNTIIDVFKSFGINWGEWGYQRCPDFPLAVRRNREYLSPVVEERIKVQARTHIGVIASYLASIEKATTLGTRTRTHLIEELENSFRSSLSSEWISGLASYCLGYSRKYSP